MNETDIKKLQNLLTKLNECFAKFTTEFIPAAKTESEQQKDCSDTLQVILLQTVKTCLETITEFIREINRIKPENKKEIISLLLDLNEKIITITNLEQDNNIESLISKVKQLVEYYESHTKTELTRNIPEPRILLRSFLDRFSTCMEEHKRVPEVECREYRMYDSMANFEEEEADIVPESYTNPLIKHFLLLRNAFNFSNNVLSSVYAPKSIQRKATLKVQVYIFRKKNEQDVCIQAVESDPETERRGHTKLFAKLKKGDKIGMILEVIEGLKPEKNPAISRTWNGEKVNGTFNIIIPENYNYPNVTCSITITINKIPVGQFDFSSMISDYFDNEILETKSRKYKKVFISYASEDYEKVKFLAEGLKIQDCDYFFDKHSLKSGDVYNDVIEQKIKESDLFILCWSKNAEGKPNIQKEIDTALPLAWPKCSKEDATLKFYPICIDSNVHLPEQLSKTYQFGKI